MKAPLAVMNVQRRTEGYVRSESIQAALPLARTWNPDVEKYEGLRAYFMICPEIYFCEFLDELIGMPGIVDTLIVDKLRRLLSSSEEHWREKFHQKTSE